MRLIDADALIWWLNQGLKCSMLKEDVQLAYSVVKHKVDKEFPTIDAVPVVRCKDCKWWREETDHTCRKWGGASPRNANGYCDDGERSEE